MQGLIKKMYLCIGLTLVDIDFNQNRLNLAKEVEECDTNDKKLSKPKLYRIKQILSCVPIVCMHVLKLPDSSQSLEDIAKKSCGDEALAIMFE